MTATFLKKITARTIECESEPGQSFVIYGRLLRASAKESQFGPYVQFGGQFHAVNEVSGKEYTSATFLSPGVAEDVLFSAIQSAQVDDKNASAEFAMRFKTIKKEKEGNRIVAMGYVWEAEFLHEPTGDDPLSRLRETLKDKIQLIAPPKDGDDKEDAKKK